MKKAKFVMAAFFGLWLFTLAAVFGLHSGSVASASAQNIERSVGIGVAGITGFLIQSVETGSPAEQYGIRPGDVIVSLDGHPVKSAQDMSEIFRNWATTPDRLIEVVFLRYDPSLNQVVDHRFKTKPVIKSEQVNASSHRTVSAGVLDGKATTKPKAIYPDEAKVARASGDVVVRIVVSEDGTVETAEAISGHPLLQRAAVDAAYKARFPPTMLSGQPVKLVGVITYNFVLP